MECIDNLAHYTRPFGKSVMIAYCNTNCRCNLCNYTISGSASASQTSSILRLDRNSSCRTEYTTLSTVYALCLCNLFIKRRHNHSFCSTECKSKCSDSLKFLAGTYTVSAEDTFVRITNQRRRTEIQLMLLSCILETDVLYARDDVPVPEGHIHHSLHRLYSHGNVLQEAVPQSVSCIF